LDYQGTEKLLEFAQSVGKTTKVVDEVDNGIILPVEERIETALVKVFILL